MRTLVAVALSTFALASPALAETCQEKFMRILVERNASEPVKIHATQKIKGGMATKNWNYQDGAGNWMTESIEPANLPWTLVQGDTMYTSMDKGKSWKKVRTMDTAHDPAETKKLQSERAKTVRNAKCGSEELDGTPHEVVEATYDMLGQFNAEVTDKYWVHPQTGYIPKLETTMKTETFESYTLQLVEPSPDLQLPKP